MAGFYCSTASTLRSPAAVYATDWNDGNNSNGNGLCNPISSVTNWWEVGVPDVGVDYVGADGTFPYTDENGDECVPEDYCGEDASNSATCNTGSCSLNNLNANVCRKGHTCAQTATDLTSCTAGYYCPDPYMSTVDTANHECRIGFYCSGGAHSFTPGNPNWFDKPSDPDASGDDSTGDICRVGHYCPANSSKQFSCGTSLFMPYEMAGASSDCIACPEGKYCDVSGEYDLTGTNKDCDAGYYCALNAITATQNQCILNEKCVSGTLYPEQCLFSQFTTTAASDTCTECDDGKTCPGGT